MCGHGLQEQVNPIEAASLRIASLEEQQQSAIQAKAGEAERAEAAKRQTKPKQYSPLCSPPAPPSAAPQKAAQATQQPSGLMSLVSSLMPPPSPRFRSSAAQSLATSSQAPAENDPSAASVLPVAELPAARPTEGSSPARLTSQLQSGGTSRAEPMQLNVPVSAWPVGSAPASALAASPASASTAAATALSIPAGLPAATAAVAAASDALIARFKADGIGAHTSSPATATAAPAPAATATTAAADTTRAPAPRMSALSQIASALSAREGNAESLRRHSPQTRSGVASVGSLSSSGQPTQSHTSAADVARPPPYNGQPEMQAAPPAAAADAFLSSAVANGRAALAAMPLIESPNSDSERGGGSGWRFRARTPAKSQTKQQLELLDQMAREVKERWQQGLADAAKVPPSRTHKTLCVRNDIKVTLKRDPKTDGHQRATQKADMKVHVLSSDGSYMCSRKRTDCPSGAACAQTACPSLSLLLRSALMLPVNVIDTADAVLASCRL